jgi:hypothetical protein
MDPSEIISLVLAALTGVYVVYTGRLNHHARTSARAAEKSAAASETATAASLETAQASQRAAEAAERSAALSEAVIPVDFSARVTTTDTRTIVFVRSETASVYVFWMYVRLFVVPDTGSIREISGSTQMENDEGDPALFLHQGEEAMAVLAEPLSPGDIVMGHATVRYGFQTAPVGRDRFIEIKHQSVTGIP